MNSVPRVSVIGHPISHSRSPMLHNYWLKRMGIPGIYEKLDVAPEALEAFFADFKRSGFIGANITVPHKAAAAHYVSRLDEAAEAIGAINTVWLDDGALVGGNTDAHGFIANLDDRAPGWDQGTAQALLIGAGGAARAAIHGLRERGLTVNLVNRTAERAEALAREFGDGVLAKPCAALPDLLTNASLLVNVTSLGMVGKPPLEIDLAPLKIGAVVYDVVYVPLETPLLRAARARGHRVVDGLGMLIHQGAKGFSEWFGKTPEITTELREMLEDDIRATAPPA